MEIWFRVKGAVPEVKLKLVVGFVLAVLGPSWFLELYRDSDVDGNSIESEHRACCVMRNTLLFIAK